MSASRAFWKFMSLDGVSQRDVMRAFYELALARCLLVTHSAKTLYQLRHDEAEVVTYQNPAIHRVSIAIGRAASYCPWRTDCLVRALAAHRWLKSLGVTTSLNIGARKNEKGIEFHAWLCAGNHLVVGGDISDHAIFSRD